MVNQQRRVAYFVLPLVALATAASAQIYGYPIDPADQRPNSTTSTRPRSTGAPDQDANGNDTASTAAQSQGQLSGSETRYRPDQIDSRDEADRSDATRRRNGQVTDGEDELVRETVRPLIQSPPPLSEFERYVSQIVDKPLRRFGSSLLVPGSRDFTAPPTTTVPPTTSSTRATRSSSDWPVRSRPATSG